MTMPNLTLENAIKLAVEHHRSGQLREAESIYRQILERHPDQPDALRLLSMLMQQRGDTAAALDLIHKAIAAYRKAIERAPNAVDPRRTLAMLLIATGQTPQAIAELEALVRLQSPAPDDWNSLGNLYSNDSRLPEALAAYDEALRLRPDFPEALSNRGDVLLGLGQADFAIESCQKAIALRPEFVDPYNNLGNALRSAGRIGEAIRAYRRALALNPSLIPTYGNLGNALTDQGLNQEAEDAYRHSIRLQPHLSQAHSNLLTHLIAGDQHTPEEIFAEHRNWNRLHAQPLLLSPPSFTNDPDPDRRLRIGYVSPDFRHHAVASFAQTFLSRHDHREFEIFCYADEHTADAMTAQLRPHADHWRAVTPLTDAQLAQQIREDQIDLLIDLAGHTSGNRLLTFALKPAPLQITYLGYPATTGLSAMDFRITDAVADPPGETDALHTEQLIRLDNCFLCYRIPDDLPPITPLPALATGHVTFGSFNKVDKLSDSTLTLWAKVLASVPHSRLMLKFRSLADQASREIIIARLHAQGIPPGRVELLPHASSHADHLNDYRRVDIALDPFPYNGTTTTCEALSMGIPVITLAGRHHAARVGASLLTAIGHPEWIAADHDSYIRLAQNLAADLSSLAKLRANLRDPMRASSLCDETGFTRSLEAAYRQMWRTWCANRA